MIIKEKRNSTIPNWSSRIVFNLCSIFPKVQSEGLLLWILEAKTYHFDEGQLWSPSLECLYQYGVYYESRPSDQCIFCGIHQYVISDHQVSEFWPFALPTNYHETRSRRSGTELPAQGNFVYSSMSDATCSDWWLIASMTLAVFGITGRSGIALAVPSISRKVPASSRMDSSWRSVSCTACSSNMKYSYKFNWRFVRRFTW